MKFTEEQLQKIRESLLANGIPEDVVEFTISDLEGKETEDEKKESENEEAKEGDPTDKEEGNPEEPKPEDDVPPAAVKEDNGEAAPAEEPVEEVPPVAVEEEVLAPEVPPVEETAVDPEAAAAVGYDDSEIRSLYEEQKKVTDALLDRVKSLEEALRQSGVLVDEEGTTPVGAELPSAPANEPEDDPIDDVLRQINGHKY